METRLRFSDARGDFVLAPHSTASVGEGGHRVLPLVASQFVRSWFFRGWRLSDERPRLMELCRSLGMHVIDPTRVTDLALREFVERAVESGRIHLFKFDPPKYEGGSGEQHDTLPPTEESASKTWIEIELVDDDGHPVRGRAYKINLPNGAYVEGRLDSNGRARVDGLDPGTCRVTFPDLDETSWNPA